MLKQTIPFKDYNDQDREVTEYFHLSEAEIVDLQAKSVNGIQADMQDAILSNDAGKVLDFIKNLVHRSYGKKSQDGVHFEKSPEILNRFISSAYYSDFLLGLIQDDGRKGQEFVKGIMPAKLLARALAQVQGEDGGEADRKVYGKSAREVFNDSVANKESTTPETTNFPEPVQAPVTQDFGPADQMAKFREWQAQQQAQQQVYSSEPVSPDAFRVREGNPSQSQSGERSH